MSFLGLNLFDSNPRYDLIPVRLNIPHVSQEGRPECGIASTMMVLKYFGVRNPDRQRIKNMAELPYADATSVYGLTHALVSYDLDVSFFAPKKKHSRKSRKNTEERLYNLGVSKEQHLKTLIKMKEDAILAGVKMHNQDFSLEDILRQISVDKIPLIVINRRRLAGLNGIGPHVVVLTGFDMENVFYNNPAFRNGYEVMDKKSFEMAMNDIRGGVIFTSRRTAK